MTDIVAMFQIDELREQINKLEERIKALEDAHPKQVETSYFATDYPPPVLPGKDAVMVYRSGFGEQWRVEHYS
jgi:hypothetical protein